MKYVVLCTEHDETYSQKPMVCGKFDTITQANSFISDAVCKSLMEFPKEQEEGFGVVREYDEDGFPTYGCVWSVVRIAEEMNMGTNKFGVPYEKYSLWFDNGTGIGVDIGNEDDWGNIQECAPGDCKDWENSIGFGNDADGHLKIVSVDSKQSNDSWIGTDAVRSWFDTKVKVWAKNYSA